MLFDCYDSVLLMKRVWCILFYFYSREPSALVNLSKLNSVTGEEELVVLLNKHKPKAARHIFLVRHSQYRMNGKTDVDRVLTSLG